MLCLDRAEANRGPLSHQPRAGLASVRSANPINLAKIIPPTQHSVSLITRPLAHSPTLQHAVSPPWPAPQPLKARNLPNPTALSPTPHPASACYVLNCAYQS